MQQSKINIAHLRVWLHFVGLLIYSFWFMAINFLSLTHTAFLQLWAMSPLRVSLFRYTWEHEVASYLLHCVCNSFTHGGYLLLVNDGINASEGVVYKHGPFWRVYIRTWFTSKGQIIFNSLRPRDAYMRHWTGPSLVQITACRLDGAKLLSKPMLGYCLFES